MKTSLSQISEKFFLLYRQIEENEGELTPEIEDQLKITEEEFSEKIEDYCFLFEQYKAESGSTKDLAKKYTERAKSLENLSNKFGETIKQAIKLYGKSRKTDSGLTAYDVDIPDGEITLTPTQSVIINSSDLVPDKYKEFSISVIGLTAKESVKLEKLLTKAKFHYTPDISIPKDLVGADLKKSIKVPGAELMVNHSIKRKVKAAKAKK